MDLKEILEYIDPSDCNYQEWVNTAWRLSTRAIQRQIGIPGLPAMVAGIMPANALKKWNSFEGSSNPVTGGTIVQMAQDRGWSSASSDPGYLLDWDSVIQRDDYLVIDKGWLEAVKSKNQ